MQLQYPWFLIGLLAVAIPIVIHLLQLRKPQRILFSNIAFIRAVEVVTVRHRRVQQLLILLARILTISALVFVFCRPFTSNKNYESGRALSGEVDVLVDNSSSMQLRGNASGSLFEDAVAEARELGLTLSANRRIKLVGHGGNTLNQLAYQEKLEALKISTRNPFLDFRDARFGEAKAGVYVFSDFQKSEFNTKILTTMSTGREVVLVPVVGKPTGNIYVDSVWLDDAFLRVRTNVGLHVRVRNGGRIRTTDCPVKVFLGQRQVAAFGVTVDAGAAVTSVVQVQVSDGTLALGRVVTEDSPVVFDNTYYFTLQPAAAIRVLEIGAEPGLQQLYANEPLFTYAFAKSQSVNYAELRQANLVVLREVGEVDAGLRDGLRAVLKRGGSVVIVPSAMEMGRNSYQQLFKELGMGTVEWEAKTVTPELREVAMPNVRGAFFREVFGAQPRTVTMPRAAPVLRWARTGTDILRLRDGESYLASFASAAGQVYVFSAPFAKEYTDFATHALFVPVMYRMAMLSYHNEHLPAYRMSQGTVRLELAGAANTASERADEAGFRLVKDSLTLIPGQRVLGQEVRLEVPVGLNAPGFYQVRRHGKILTTLAFNQDRQESELAAYSADELRQLIGPNRPNIRVLEGGTDAENLMKFLVERATRPLWRYFLALTLVGLLAEALLVRFGSRRVGAAMTKQGA